MNSYSLKLKLLVVGIGITLIPIAINLLTLYKADSNLMEIIDDEVNRLAIKDLDHIVQITYDMVQTQHRLLENQIKNDVNTLALLVDGQGGLTRNKQSADIVFKNAAEEVLVRDVIARWSSSLSSTIHFLEKKESGAFYPVETEDEDNQEVKAQSIAANKLLNGEEYERIGNNGLNYFYSHFVPAYDSDTYEIIGAWEIRMPFEPTPDLRKAIMRTKVGETGYIFVLGGKGDYSGHYLISLNGKRDGENIIGAKDANGFRMIQQMVDYSKEMQGDEIREVRYEWKNANDTDARMKISRIVYFEPWDWIIGAGAYYEDFYQAKEAVTNTRATIVKIVIVEVLGMLLFASILWWFIASGFTKKITDVVLRLRTGSSRVVDSVDQIAAASDALAHGSSDQASSLRDTSQSVHEMFDNTNESVKRANALKTQMEKVNHLSSESEGDVRKMNAIVQQIKKSSDEQAGIISTIDEIAFQTNLLALNAAVEAARAGEAGLSFAVVAEEVRMLAQRSAEAARNTAELIEQSINQVNEGVVMADKVEKSLMEISNEITNSTEEMMAVSSLSESQLQAIDMVKNTIQKIEAVTETNAASSEETAASAQDLKGLSIELGEVMSVLSEITNGGKNIS